MGCALASTSFHSQYPAIFDLDVWENELQQFDAAGEIREKSNTAGRSQTTCAARKSALFSQLSIAQAIEDIS